MSSRASRHLVGRRDSRSTVAQPLPKNTVEPGYPRGEAGYTLPGVTRVDPSVGIEAFRGLVRSPIVFTGFRWVVVRCDGGPFDDDALVGAVNDSLRALARSGATAPEIEPVARQLAGIADKLARSGRALRDAVGLTLLSIDTAVPSGRLGRLHLTFWAALQRELLRRGVRAEGPGSTPQDRARGRAAPTLSWRLFFDPSDVGIREPSPWKDAPETALELGLRRPNGQTMAGIDYLASTGSEVRAWSDVLPDLVQADERGGRVPFLIHHGQRELPPPERFGPLLGRAVREAVVGLVEPALSEEIASDFRAVQMPTLALVRPGPRVASRLDGQHYALLVRRAAAALGRYGVPVADAGDQAPLMAQQLLRDAPGHLLDWDYHLFASVAVARKRAGDQQTTEEVRRLQAVTSRSPAALTPIWLLEPGAPLAELAAARRSGTGALSVVVMANAALPKDGAPQAAAWLHSVLNGGERGRRRALQDVAGARHVGAVALTRASLGAALRQTLPGRTRRAVEEVREACRARLHEGSVLRDGRLAESMAQLAGDVCATPGGGRRRPGGHRRGAGDGWL